MQWIANLKMTFKLGILIIVGLVSLGAVDYTGYHYLKESNSYMGIMYDDQLMPIKILNETRSHIVSSNGAVLELMLTDDDRKNVALKGFIEQRGKEIDENFAKVNKIQLDPKAKELLEKVIVARQKYLVAREPVIALALENKNAEAYALYTVQVDPFSNAYIKTIEDITDYFAKSSEEVKRNNEISFQRAVMIMHGIALISLIILVISGLMITKVITKALKALTITCEELADGDFCEKPQRVVQKDEIGHLADALLMTRKKVNDLMVKINVAAHHVASSSEELTASAEQSSQATNQIAISITDVANGADKQLAAANEASAVVATMTNNVQQVAKNTNHVAEQSAQAAYKAQEGGKAVNKAITQMGNIENTVNTSAGVVSKLGDRSKEIGAIIDTISGIAGQTNLLALNAAIEAARAGEQGRGFAVVAEEVRKLAEQSQEATKKIAELIGEIQKDTQDAVSAMNDGTREVKTGAEVVNAAGVAFQEIAELVTQVSSQVKEISNSLQEVVSGSQKIVNSMMKIDELSKKSSAESQSVSAATEEQTASMQEVAYASESLSKMALELQATVDRFCVYTYEEWKK
ncbi:methyl-accepting chemotaxis protein [Pelosinus sp. sgz500959]|uniref:methyl-accepting chemotaxis protein n=1 Tax=Pelosinus sp. sgz500959 TaxID=3242472 RepID=UPI00366A77F7